MRVSLCHHDTGKDTVLHCYHNLSSYVVAVHWYEFTPTVQVLCWFNVSLFHVGSKNSSQLLESPTMPQSMNLDRLNFRQVPSPLAADLSTKIDLSPHTSLADSPLADSLMHSASGTPQQQHKAETSAKSSLQDSLLMQQSLEEQSLGGNVSRSESPPPHLPHEQSKESVETPSTSHHSSINESYSPAGEVGGGESESEDEESASEQQDTPSSKRQPLVEQSSHPIHKHRSPSSGVTTPDTSAFLLTAELPPTPFQYANFDLDSSSDEQEESDVHSKVSTSFDDFRSLEERVQAFITQEEENEHPQSSHDREGLKLVDIDEQPSCEPLLGRKAIVDSANSLKVDDLLNLDSPLLAHQQLQSPLHLHHSPQVGKLIDIGTPGSDLAARPPLLTSTADKPFLTPASDVLLPYLMPTYSGTQSGTSVSIESGKTWSSLESKYIAVKNTYHIYSITAHDLI